MKGFLLKGTAQEKCFFIIYQSIYLKFSVITEIFVQTTIIKQMCLINECQKV